MVTGLLLLQDGLMLSLQVLLLYSNHLYCLILLMILTVQTLVLDGLHHSKLVLKDLQVLMVLMDEEVLLGLFSTTT